MNDTKKGMNPKRIVIGLVILAVIIAGLFFSYNTFREKPVEGTKHFTVEVVDDAGKSKMYEATTDVEFLRDALEELDGFSIEGEESEYGLFVKKINGVTADYDVNGAYWSFYVNDGYCNNGIETQPVNDGDAFRIVYEVGAGE